MKCQNCDGRAITSDSRCVSEGSEVYRRRKCEKCGYVIFTRETQVEYEGEFRKDWIKHKKMYETARKKAKEVK